MKKNHRYAFGQILLFCWRRLVKSFLVALLFFFSASSLITNIRTQTRARIYTTVLCVVRILFFFYVNKNLFFFYFFALFLSLFSPFVRVHEHTGNIYIWRRVEEEKKIRRERLVGSALLAPIERTREFSRDDVNTTSSFILLMLLFLLIQDITL
jgi:hypothetical protein